MYYVSSERITPAKNQGITIVGTNSLFSLNVTNAPQIVHVSIWKTISKELQCKICGGWKLSIHKSQFDLIPPSHKNPGSCGCNLLWHEALWKRSLSFLLSGCSNFPVFSLIQPSYVIRLNYSRVFDEFLLILSWKNMLQIMFYLALSGFYLMLFSTCYTANTFLLTY